MLGVVKYLYRLALEAYEQHYDPRTQHLPLLGPPFVVAGIIAIYLCFVLHYGPKWMKNRKPYELKGIMQIYNAVQVVANMILLYYGIKNSYWRKDFSWTCQPIDHSITEPWMMQLIYVTYGYYLTKYLDLLDTVFFVLRKKTNQISFLHVYHHAGMVAALYFYMNFWAGSHSTMLGAINLLVHVIMYSYYFVTSMQSQKSTVWWKRHITQLQLAQFGYLIVHFLMPIVNNHCNHTRIVLFVGFMQNFFMFSMFFDFYYKTYIRKNNAAPGSDDKTTAANVNETSKIAAENRTNKLHAD